MNIQVHNYQIMGGGIVYNNYLLNIFIDIINSNGVAFETNIYEYSIDVDNFDIGFYAYDAIILCKLMDNYIKCFYYGQNIENIANALNLISTLPYNFDYILEIQYKGTNQLNDFIANNFTKLATLIKLFKKSSCELKDLTVSNEIQCADNNDVKDILSLQHSIFNKYIERNLSLEQLLSHINNKSVFLYKKNSEILGCIVYHNRGKFTHLNYIFINPKYKGLGIGNYLFMFFLHNNKQNNIELWCREDNTAALKLYKKYELKPTELKSDIYIYKK